MIAEFQPDVVAAMRTLASKVETPFYLLNVGNIKHRFEQFLSAWRERFPDFACAYSYKTNPLPVVTRALRPLGARAEVVTATELEWAFADGYCGSEIYFNGPAKSESGIRRAIETGVTIQVDSLDELERVIRNSGRRTPPVAIRMACALDDGNWSRLGLLPEECWFAIDRMGSAGSWFRGVHFHVGSNLNTTVRHVRALCESLPIARALIAESGSEQKIQLNIGGGFPAQSSVVAQPVLTADCFADAIRDALRAAEVDSNRIQIMAEPGRTLVEDEGFLVTRVVARKTRGGFPILIVDAGLDLIRSIGAWYHPISFIEHAGCARTNSYGIYGARSYERDELTPEVCGPADVGVGTLIAVGSAGGYDLTTASVWGGCCPSVFCVQDGAVFDLSRSGRLAVLARPEINSAECV